MPLYGGIDLHANNSVVVLRNEQDQMIFHKRVYNGHTGACVVDNTACQSQFPTGTPLIKAHFPSLMASPNGPL